MYLSLRSWINSKSDHTVLKEFHSSITFAYVQFTTWKDAISDLDVTTSARKRLRYTKIAKIHISCNPWTQFRHVVYSSYWRDDVNLFILFHIANCFLHIFKLPIVCNKLLKFAISLAVRSAHSSGSRFNFIINPLTDCY